MYIYFSPQRKAAKTKKIRGPCEPVNKKRLLTMGTGIEQRPWTPTVRRGKIAAETSSPGPACVQLPTLVGMKNKKILVFFRHVLTVTKQNRHYKYICYFVTSFLIFLIFNGNKDLRVNEGKGYKIMDSVMNSKHKYLHPNRSYF